MLLEGEVDLLQQIHLIDLLDLFGGSGPHLILWALLSQLYFLHVRLRFLHVRLYFLHVLVGELPGLLELAGGLVFQRDLSIIRHREYIL